MSKLVKVRFISRFAVYNPGEIASFEEDEALKLVEKTKVASFDLEPKAEEVKAPKAKKKATRK